MKILSTTLLISFMTVFAIGAHAGSDGSENQVAQSTNKPRLATTKDLIDAGYRQGYAAALENTPAGSSSVTTPLSYRKPVYVQAPTTQPRLVSAPAPAPARVSTPAPRKLPSYVQRMQPKVQPTVPNMQPKQRHNVQRIQQQARHAGHEHHTQAQVIDCELTDSLNRGASPVTTVISTQKYHRPVASPFKQPQKPRPPARKPAPRMPVANIKHDDHYHHTHHEKADCALTDALNRRAGPVSRVISSSKYHNHSPVKQHIQKRFSHGDHSHHSEVDRADCALTDSLNRRGSVVRLVRKH